MNGVTTNMYPLRQIIQHDAKLPLPDCMYKMKNIHGPNTQPINLQSGETIREQNNETLDNTEMISILDRQEAILRQLDSLRQQMELLKTNLLSSNASPRHRRATSRTSHTEASLPTVAQRLNNTTVIIKASPAQVPHFLLAVKALWKDLIDLRIQTHLHSSISALPDEAEEFVKAIKIQQSKQTKNLPVLNVRLLWKDVSQGTELSLANLAGLSVAGDANVLRYFARLVPECLIYESAHNVHEIDAVLDACYLLAVVKTKTGRAALLQNWSKTLSKAEWLCGSKMTVADVAVGSVIKNVPSNEISAVLNKWLKKYHATVDVAE